MSETQHINTINYDIEGRIHQFVMQVPSISSAALGQQVKDMFENDPEIEGIVVIDNHHPAGLIMRTAFYQQIGSLHGHALFMKRPITLVMDTAMMVVDVEDNLSQIGIQAMNREQSKLYDFVLVRQGSGFLGVISIRHFLVDLANRNAAQINVLKFQQQELLAAHRKEMQLIGDLENKSNAVRNLLDNADQGFLLFEQDLVVKNEFSFKCMELFQRNIGGDNFTTLVSPYFDPEKVSVFNAAFDSYFKNNNPVTDNIFLMLLPSNCIISGKHIRMEYRRITNNGNKAVMAIFNDITERINLERAMERERNSQRLLIKAFSCQAQIRQMIEEFTELFSGGYSGFFDGDIRAGLQELFRAVHTFKGDFAQYGFLGASDKIHVFEDRLSQLVTRAEEVNVSEILAVMSELDANEVLQGDMEVVTQVLGEGYFNQQEIICIPKLKALEAERWVLDSSSLLARGEVLQMLRSLRLQSLKAQLQQYQDYIQYLSDRLLKSMPVFIVEGDDVEIDADLYRGFCKALVHVFRNIMDHGIEPDEERLECGKTQRGLIVCRIYREDKQFTIQISDDGRGIDLEKVKSRATERLHYTADQLNCMSQQQLTNLVFLDSVTTKDAVSALSGRGVGLSAFLDACVRLGGKAEISTKQGEGTVLTVTLPISHQEC